jgi:AcrR family transcriptional regulator
VRTSHSDNSNKKNSLNKSITSHLDGIREDRPSIRLAAGKTEKTCETIKKIIFAAHEVFTRDGHAGLTLRNVADLAGIAVGNLTYHFSTKRDLLETMLREVLTIHVEQNLVPLATQAKDPLHAMLDIVEFSIRDAPNSHRFFYQIWGYAGSDRQARKTIRNLYMPVGMFGFELVRAANPKLTEVQTHRAVLQIFSLIEGYKLFLGLTPDNQTALDTAARDIRVLTERILFPE